MANLPNHPAVRDGFVALLHRRLSIFESGISDADSVKSLIELVDILILALITSDHRTLSVAEADRTMDDRGSIMTPYLHDLIKSVYNTHLTMRLKAGEKLLSEIMASELNSGYSVEYLKQLEEQLFHVMQVK